MLKCAGSFNRNFNVNINLPEDTLERMALRLLGDATRWIEIAAST